MKDSKKNPAMTDNKGYQQTQSNQPNQGNPQKGSDEGKPAWKPGSEKTQKPERGEDEHQHENKQPVSNPKGEKNSSKGVNKPGDTATGTSQEGSTGTEKSNKKSVSSDSMGSGVPTAGGGRGNVD